jgi:hypothetical protein
MIPSSGCERKGILEIFGYLLFQELYLCWDFLGRSLGRLLLGILSPYSTDLDNPHTKTSFTCS